MDLPAPQNITKAKSFASMVNYDVKLVPRLSILDRSKSGAEFI